jgi:hypothetical protein
VRDGGSARGRAGPRARHMFSRRGAEEGDRWAVSTVSSMTFPTEPRLCGSARDLAYGLSRIRSARQHGAVGGNSASGSERVSSTEPAQDGAAQERAGLKLEGLDGVGRRLRIRRQAAHGVPALAPPSSRPSRPTRRPRGQRTEGMVRVRGWWRPLPTWRVGRGSRGRGVIRSVRVVASPAHLEGGKGIERIGGDPNQFAGSVGSYLR